MSKCPVLFVSPSLDIAILEELRTETVQAECLLWLPQASPSQGQQEQPPQAVLLQIIGNFVVQSSPDRSQVVSAFECDYEVQFEMMRRMQPVAGRVGEVEGVRFEWKQQCQAGVLLLVRPDERGQLQRFCGILGRKFIIQLGFHSCFKANKKIGKGMTACVYNANNLATGREVAIKSFKRSLYFSQDNGNGKSSFLKEFKILTQVSHKNICQLYSVFETDNSTYVILELYPLSLYGYLQKCGFPSPQQAKSIMINLLEGVGYLHTQGIMHRDLKLENIMVKRDALNSQRVIPVIVDLGLAEYTSSQKYLYTRCGTPGYVAPQVLKIKSTDPVQTYTSACDIFSLGVIFHILLFKRPVFEGKEVKEVIKKNGECDIDFNSAHFDSLDEQGRDLLKRMLCKDPASRITACQALQHPFLIEERKQLEIEAELAFRTAFSL